MIRQSIGLTELQAGHDDIVADVRNSAALKIDETRWRENDRNAWLWTVVGMFCTLFSFRPSRSSRQLRTVCSVTMRRPQKRADG